MSTIQVTEPVISQDEQQKLNAELGRRINRETRANPDSPYAGKYVVISQGEVVAVVDNADEVHRSMKILGLDAENSGYIQASADYDSPMWIVPRLELG